MKLNLDETLFDPDKLDDHYAKHVAPDLITYLLDFSDESLDPMSKEEYNHYADEISKTPVTSSDYDDPNDVVGFVGKNRKGSESIYKFKKSTSELVIYYSNEKESRTLSYYKVQTATQKARYEKLKRLHYLREIIPEDDRFNK